MKEEHLPEKTKQMMIKGGNGGAKNNLEGGAKSSDGAVAAFDLEAFVKVKFSELKNKLDKMYADITKIVADF